MNFVKSSSSNSTNGPSTKWTNNPIYQSPESANVSWYSQATHWDPASEGIASISQSSTNDPIPYWTNREQNLEGVRTLYTSPQKTNVQGLGYTPPVAQEASSSFASSSRASELASTATREAALNRSSNAVASTEAVVGGVQAAEGVASLVPGPGTLLLINSLAGDATASAINAGEKNTIASDYLHNVKQTGSQSNYQASLIQQMEQARSNANLAGGKIGGLFGPLGAFFGHMLASAFQDTNPNAIYDDYKTSYSFDGRVNPQDTGLVNSGNTEMMTGQTNMQQNV